LPHVFEGALQIARDHVDLKAHRARIAAAHKVADRYDQIYTADCRYDCDSDSDDIRRALDAWRAVAEQAES
jgi:hypothetical protein